MSSGIIWETFGNHLGSIWETSGRVEAEEASGEAIPVAPQAGGLHSRWGGYHWGGGGGADPWTPGTYIYIYTRVYSFHSPC